MADVLSATFVDFKLVKTRRVVQLVFEMPSEHAQQALELLGMPDASREVWVAIARLTGRPGAPPAIPHDEGANAVKAAALRCTEEPFQRWLLGNVYRDGAAVTNEENAAEELRNRLGIHSRAELARDTRALNAWRELITQFQRETRV